MLPIKRVLVVLLLSGIVAGCGSARINARGKLLKKGEPFTPAENEIVQIAFFPAETQSEDARSYLASFNRADGSFKVIGKDGRGLPAGKYRVTVQLIKDRKDQLKGAFNVKHSPLLCDVSSAADEIKLDLSTPSQAPSAETPTKSVRRSKS
jgi:hypothetical protein